MTRLASGAALLYSGANPLSSSPPGGDVDVPLAISFDVASSNDFTTSTSLVDLNASNNVVTFTAPASGNVLVVLEALVQPDNGNVSGKVAYWGLRESTTNIAGPYEAAVQHVTGSAYYTRASLSIYLTGISAGSHTYKWAHRASSSAQTICVGGSQDPRVMTVYACP